MKAPHTSPSSLEEVCRPVSDPVLKQAYERTTYWVFPAPHQRFPLRCGDVSAALDLLLTLAQCQHWAFISACNPQSVQLTSAENAVRMAHLAAVVEQGGWACLPALGEGAAGDWPPEQSLLVLGIQAAEALALARQFDQAALLLGTLGEPVRLAWTDS